MTDATDFLLGGGSASAKFDEVGDTVTGTIAVTPEVRDQTDIQTGRVLTWDNGDVRKQLVITLDTSERRSDDPDDDGRRSIYVKGSKRPGSQSLHDAVATAVRNAGASGLQIGGTLTVKFIGEEPSQTRGFNPRKLYEASYQPPSSGEFLGTDQPPAQPATAPTPAPAAQQPEPGQDKVSTAKQLISAGVDDATIVSATGLDATTIGALRAAA